MCRVVASSAAIGHVFFPTSSHTTASITPPAGETITSNSKALYRTGGSSLVNNNGVPQSATSRAFAEQGNQNVGNRRSLEFLPSSVTGGAMPASRNPFRSLNMRPSNDNPFDAAIQAVEEARSRAEGMSASPFGSRMSHRSQHTPASLSLKGSKIMQLLAANQNGSIASPSSISHLSHMTPKNNPFAMPERIVSRNNGLQFLSRGIKLQQRRMAPESEMNEFAFDTPTIVDVPSSLCFRHTPNRMDELRAKLERPSSIGMKRASDDSSSSSDSSCGSRKQARRLGVMNVSDRNDGTVGDAQRLIVNDSGVNQQPTGGFDRFRNRRQSNESQSSSVTSQPVPPVVNTVTNRSRTAPPLRFFNNGVEVDINGNPIAPSRPPAPEPEPEIDLDTLKDHQASVWDHFTEKPEETEARMKKKKPRRKKSVSSSDEEPAKPLNLQVDPTPSAFSADPNKLASADVDDLVRDSLKEREKTLSAASVLLGFLGQSDNKKPDATQHAEI